MSVPSAGFSALAEAVALATGVAKTVVGLKAGANKGLKITEIGVGADGTTGNLLVELVYGTDASNSPGTNSTSITPATVRGTDTLEASAAKTWTAEPTVLTVIKAWRFALPGGPLVIQNPLGREPSGVQTAATLGKVIAIRLTASAGCNADCYIEFEE